MRTNNVSRQTVHYGVRQLYRPCTMELASYTEPALRSWPVIHTLHYGASQLHRPYTMELANYTEPTLWSQTVTQILQ